MTYKLLKELAEAGFPYNLCEWTDEHLDRDSNKHVPLVGLSELIEACGDDFRFLVRHTQFNRKLVEPWEAVPNKKRRPEVKGQKGKTAEIAVARLWLALNKKVVC